MSNMLQVIENALVRAKADKCTRHIGKEGYVQGKSAFEYVNADLAAAGYPAIKKGQLDVILGTKEMAAKGLTRFDANEPKPRTHAPSILDQLGLTPKEKIARKKTVAESSNTTAGTTESPAQGGGDNDWESASNVATSTTQDDGLFE